MKYFIYSLFFLLFVFPGICFAEDASISARAKDLYDRASSIAAQLSESSQKSYTGQIKSLGSSTIIITTKDKQRAIQTNDATSFYRIRAGNRSEISFTALKIGDAVASVGIIDPVSFDLTARQVIAKISRQNISGVIKSIDNQIYSIENSDNTITRVDLADVPLKKLDQNGKIISGKIDEIKQGSYIFVIAVTPDETTGIFSALKALVIL